MQQYAMPADGIGSWYFIYIFVNVIVRFLFGKQYASFCFIREGRERIMRFYSEQGRDPWK